MKRSKTTAPGGGSRRHAIRRTGGAAVALFAVLTIVVPGAASAASTGTSTAVVTPLLEFFEFGNSIGTPLVCSDAGSVVSIIGVETGASALSTPLVNELNAQCARLVSEGNGSLQQAITESKSLSLINPIADPLIAALANGLNTVGTQYGPSLAPFGPTVAGLGGTVAFFEGS